MSALARYFKAMGKQVSGYDKTSTLLTKQLENEGINIHYVENTDLLPEKIDLVIYTPAVPKDNLEYIYVIEKNIPIIKRAEVLGLLTKNFKTIAIAGTHGKTTITTMVTHILKCANMKITSFMGGISKNYDTNFLLSEENEYVVAEADEYDKSFLKLFPYISVITSMDADHLDIYGDKDNLNQTFTEFALQTKDSGHLILKSGLKLLNQPKCDIATYSLKDKADIYAENIRINKGKYIFDIAGNTIIKEIELGLPGLHNVENAIAAISACLKAGVSPEICKTALSSFSGSKRRFDYRIINENFIYIDDYAHHPEELRACITSVKELFKDKKVTGIFQPHLYTRTRDFADEFAKSLSLLDEVILLDIYPARELPIEGINSQMLLDKISIKSKHLVSKNELIEYTKKLKPQILLTLGAGDIDQFVDIIEKEFKNV